MSLTTIAVAVFLKGVLVAVLAKYGKWPDYEAQAKARAQEKREEKLVLEAYRDWRQGPGSKYTAPPARRP